MNNDDYLRDVEARLLRRGFERLGDGLSPDSWLTFHRRALSLTKFGFLDTLCSVRQFDECPPVESLRELSRGRFHAALKAKVWLPRGFGGTAVSYAVVVVDHAGAEAETFISNYRPRHWASFEFPVLIDLSQSRAHYYAKSPIFGAAYYAGFRREAADLFAPTPGS